MSFDLNHVQIASPSKSPEAFVSVWADYIDEAVEHGEEEGVRDDRVVAVDEVEPVVLRQVADDVERAVEVVERDDLAADGVVEPPRGGGVQQAVAHPHACADRLRDLVDDLERVVDALLAEERAFCVALGLPICFM